MSLTACLGGTDEVLVHDFVDFIGRIANGNKRVLN
jgi:hypothetical protein